MRRVLLHLPNLTTQRIMVITSQCFVTFPALIDGRTFSLQVSREEREQSPVWSLTGGEEPPVSVAQAARLAIEEFRSRFKDADEWTLQDFSLREMCADRWVYVLSWRPKARGVIGLVSVPVLMSGTVVPLQRLTPEGTEKR